MSIRFAVDTNIAIYAFTEGIKSERSRQILNSAPYISVQLLNEFINVATRKFGRSFSEVQAALSSVTVSASEIRPLDMEVHLQARTLFQQYKLSFYDSLIVAAALLDECNVLYTEDMQHGLVIDDRLTIENPFLSDTEPE